MVAVAVISGENTYICSNSVLSESLKRLFEWPVSPCFSATKNLNMSVKNEGLVVKNEMDLSLGILFEVPLETTRHTVNTDVSCTSCLTHPPTPCVSQACLALQFPPAVQELPCHLSRGILWPGSPLIPPRASAVTLRLAATETVMTARIQRRFKLVTLHPLVNQRMSNEVSGY